MREYKRGYYNGVKKLLAIYIAFLAIQEALLLGLPILLQKITALVLHEGEKTLTSIVVMGVLVLCYIVIILVVNFFTEYFGATYSDRYQANIRKRLYAKFNAMPTDKINELGSGRILPIIMNDSAWLKNYNKNFVKFIVYFPVAILGSFVVLFTYSVLYGCIAFASVPIVLLFFWLNMRRLNKIIPPSVAAYDEYFLNIKEGIRGAKDIRILGKAEERSQEFAKHVKWQRKQGHVTDQSINLSVSFNAVLFTITTIGIILYGSYVNVKTAEDLNILNAALQYITKIQIGSHQIFQWFIDFVPRCRFTWKRLDKIYAIPDDEQDTVPIDRAIDTSGDLAISNICCNYHDGTEALDKINIVVKQDSRVAVAGGIDSGKNMLAKLLLKFIEPDQGEMTISNLNVKQINSQQWRREIISYCSSSPKFIPGTVRENMKLLSPEVTDLQIFQAFKNIGAEEFIKKFDNILDFEITERNINDSTRNLLNIVRAIIKPAKIYVFNQCFEHIKPEYLSKLMAVLAHDNKTCLFITYNDTVCRFCDNIYILKSGQVSAHGKHKELLGKNKDYRDFQATLCGVILKEEKVRRARQ